MEKEKQFKSNIEGQCPYCNAPIEYLDFDIDWREVYYNWECPKCKKEGREYYLLKFDGHCVKEDNNIINVNNEIAPE